MLSTAKDFFVLIVEPTVAEFFDEPLDLRRGCLAAISLYHLADHVALDGYTGHDKKEMDDLMAKTRAQVIASCPEFSIIDNVANATKHARLNKKSRQISSSDQIEITPGLFEAPWGEGVFAEAAELFVTLDNGVTVSLLPAVRAVLEMWTSLISDREMTGDRRSSAT